MSRHDVAAYPDTEDTGVPATPAATPASPRTRTTALTLLCFAVCLGIAAQQWTTLQLGGFDLGIFDQGVRGYAHFGLPVSSLKSFHHEFPRASRSWATTSRR